MIQTLFGNPFGKPDAEKEKEEKKPGLFDRMKQAVTRTRENLSERIEDIVSIGKEIDRDTLDELEATLISADLGVNTTHKILESLRDRADRKQIKDADELKRLLKEELLAILAQTPVKAVKSPEGEPE